MEVRPADRGDLAAIAGIAHAGSWTGLLRPETLTSVLDRQYGPGALKRRLLAGGLLVAAEPGRGPVAFAEAMPADDRVVVHIHVLGPAAVPPGTVGMLLEAVRLRHPGRPVCVEVLLGDLDDEQCCEEAGLVPGEVIQRSVFGEDVVERWWWEGLPR